MKKGFWNTLGRVLEEDMKHSIGFYIFFIAGLILSIVWLVCGGAVDGAWWGVGVFGGILLFNAAGMYLSRNESNPND